MTTPTHTATDPLADINPAARKRAVELDAVADSVLRRDEFVFPVSSVTGQAVTYMAGNSLGLMPKRVRAAVEKVTLDWGTYGVEGHVKGDKPWVDFHRGSMANASAIVGAHIGEAVIMNTLTTNLHAMLNTFYRPTAEKFRIIVEDDAFPSDRYAVDSQAAMRGFNPADAIVGLLPRSGCERLEIDVIEEALVRFDGSVAIVMLGAVNFRTGALLDIEAITKLAHQHGCIVGWDLAHAAGNVELKLHDWDVDFAVWCTYKYLNSGPGSLGGAFVHERNSGSATLPRPAGWWGNEPGDRFAMPHHFVPKLGIEGWQVSNPPILSMAAVEASLEMFGEIGMPAIRARSLRLTGFLEELLRELATRKRMNIATPADPAKRGAQISIEVDDAPALTHQLSEEYGVVADDRPPRIVRFAPAPLYCTFEDCWRVAAALELCLEDL